jgi:hypothetical protein
MSFNLNIAWHAQFIVHKLAQSLCDMQELLELAACSCDPATISKARITGLESARGVLMQLPPDDWVADQVNPCTCRRAWLCILHWLLSCDKHSMPCAVSVSTALGVLLHQQWDSRPAGATSHESLKFMQQPC